MAKDKFTAVWISHSSISSFSKCPRSYFLCNVYKDPKTNRKMKIMSPPLALGQAVHEVLESLSVLPTKDRFGKSLHERFENVWSKLSGHKGGFFDPDTEARYKNRGLEMIAKVTASPGPLKNLAVKMNEDLPHYWISEADNIVLCGKIDWLEYLPDSDSVHIIDFKTSQSEEGDDSLQLPIYHLLVKNCQNRTVSKASYWYLERDNGLVEKTLPDLEESHQKVLKVGKQMKLARQLQHFKCPTNGCRDCIPYERILAGEGQLVSQDSFGSDVYILPSKASITGESARII